MSAERAQPMVGLFKALGDETRLRIVALLCHGELCVCHLVAALDLPQSTVSRQLTVLRRLDVVSARRQGTWVHYQLAHQSDADRGALLSTLRQQFRGDGSLARDVERLLVTRGPNSCA